jgi:hypothetical protein
MVTPSGTTYRFVRCVVPDVSECRRFSIFRGRQCKENRYTSGIVSTPKEIIYESIETTGAKPPLTGQHGCEHIKSLNLTSECSGRGLLKTLEEPKKGEQDKVENRIIRCLQRIWCTRNHHSHNINVDEMENPCRNMGKIIGTRLWCHSVQKLLSSCLLSKIIKNMIHRLTCACSFLKFKSKANPFPTWTSPTG